ncbi:glutathione S-transferase L3-like isoform X1 [Carica papaya]|uniref:glutathione S-transferase L3-like isoform X1 n=1 Tax=Carica papaya TaxID=3649 RepID=UPI000B8D00B0|nr:glutathione S-transferase L3-like isoform X1 [Carica papaya]
MATAVQEKLPPALDSTADQPPLFDGTTRLYISDICPFAQRVWITRNYKGLQDKIKLVPLNLRDRPTWYKEKVYPQNKVPSLEHNGKVIGESLELIKYVDCNFEGPSLLPDDPAKKDFAEEMVKYTDTFIMFIFTSFKGDTIKEAGPAFDHLENSLHKFDDGPFFLGGFSLVDIANIPFVERFQLFFLDVWKYDIREGRPKLAAWIEDLYLVTYLESLAVLSIPYLGSGSCSSWDPGRPTKGLVLVEMNKMDAYKQTKYDPDELLEYYRRRFLFLLS